MSADRLIRKGYTYDTVETSKGQGRCSHRPVGDHRFFTENLPPINQRHYDRRQGGAFNRTARSRATSVDNTVRTVAMKPDARPRARHGSHRHRRAITGALGPASLGRVLDLLGNPIDGKGPINAKVRLPSIANRRRSGNKCRRQKV